MWNLCVHSKLYKSLYIGSKQIVHVSNVSNGITLYGLIHEKLRLIILSILHIYSILRILNRNIFHLKCVKILNTFMTL